MTRNAERGGDGLPGSRKRFSKDERRKAVTLARQRRAAGHSVRSIAKELGVSDATLGKWLRPKTAPVRPVLVVGEEESPEIRQSRNGTLTLALPGGYRVEGLTLTQLEGLLRSLR